MWYLQGCISDFTCFLTKDSTEQSFFCCQFCFTLWCNLTDKDISGTNLSTDTDDTSFIQVLQRIIADTRYITCDLFRSELCISGFCFVFGNMDRCINILLYRRSLNRTASSKL